MFLSAPGSASLRLLLFLELLKAPSKVLQDDEAFFRTVCGQIKLSGVSPLALLGELPALLPNRLAR
jgi:hypothetical protein